MSDVAHEIAEEIANANSKTKASADTTIFGKEARLVAEVEPGGGEWWEFWKPSDQVYLLAILYDDDGMDDLEQTVSRDSAEGYAVTLRGMLLRVYGRHYEFAGAGGI